MKHTLALSLPALIAARALYAATFCDFSTSVPPSMGSGWVVASAETARGKALHGTAAGTDVSVPAVLGQHPVCSFLAKNAGAADTRLAVSVDGTVVSNVLLSAGSGWVRHVVDLSSRPSGNHTVLWRIASSGSTPDIWLDDVYVGRQLTPSFTGNVDVWSGTGATEGVVTLTDGVYSGSWQTTGSGAFSWGNADEGFYIQMFAAQIGKSQYVAQCVPLSKPLSDTIVVSYELKRNTQNRPDSVCPFVSLDNGATRLQIGDFTADTNAVPLVDENWIAVTNRATIEGIGGNDNVLLGFQEMTGTGRANVTIRNFSVAYKTLATPESVGFVSSTGMVSSVSFGEDDLRIGALIAATADAAISSVVVTNARTGHAAPPKIVPLVKAPDVEKLWWSEQTVGEIWGDTLEAGETNDFTVVVEYTSTQGLETDSPETRTNVVEICNPGTVWINELSLAEGWAEFAAPTNRAISGWSLRARQTAGSEEAVAILKDSISASFDSAHAHGTRFNVGFVAVDGLSMPASFVDGVEATVELVNGSGVVESKRTFPWKVSGVFAAMGEMDPRDVVDPANWKKAGETFGWEESGTPTKGAVNVGQGVQRAVTLPLRFRSKDQNNVTVRVVADFTGGAVTNQFVIADSDPEADETEEDVRWYVSENIVLSATDSRDAMPAESLSVIATAFGYEGEASVSGDYPFDGEPPVIDIEMSSSVGIETFDLGYEGTWTKGGDTANILWQSAEPQFMYGNTHIRAASWRGATLTSVAAMDATRGNGMTKFAVSIQATSRHTARNDWDTLQASLEDASGEAENRPFLPLTNRYDLDTYASTDWVRTTQWLPLSSDGTLADAYQLMFSIKAGGNSGGDLNFDDIYLSFQDYANVTNLDLLPLTPEAGKPLKASFTVVPAGAGATDVSVTLWTSLNGGEAIPAFTTNFPSLTAPEPIVVPNLLPLAGNEGDTFVGILNCWTETTFATRNGSKTPQYMTETAYYPDNAKTGTTADGVSVRYVEGAYEHGLVAWGVQRVWVNEVNPNNTPFVELCGRAGEDIGGWRLVVLDFANGASAEYTVPAGTVLADETDGCGFFVFSHASHTGFALPAKGGIRLVDAAGTVRYAYGYSADESAAEDRDGFVRLPPAGGASIIATGHGNPENQGFDWDSGEASPGEANAGQHLSNGGPVGTRVSATPSATGAALSASAVDLDVPVEYRFAVDGTPVGDWATNATASVSGLSENTAHTFSVDTRDALGTNGLSAAQEAWTLLENWTAGATGCDTNAITLAVSIPNLGVGDTAWSVIEPSECVASDLATSAFTASSPAWGPNTEHAFALSARNGDGVLSALTNVVTAHTLAAVPGAMLSAEVDGESRSIALSLGNAADAAACRNGNAEDTEYAVRVTLFFKSADPVPPYVLDLTNGTSRAETWFTWDDFAALFDDGADPVAWVADASRGELAAQDIAFEVVARNGEHVETVTQAADPAATGVAHAHFEMSALLSAKPVQRRDGSGVVDLSARLTNPASAPCDARLEFATVENPSESDWRVATIANASVAYGADFAYGADPSGYTLRGVSTATNAENTVSIAWDAGSDLAAQDYDDILFRWVLYDAANRDEPVLLADETTADVRLALPAVDSVTPPASPAKRATSLSFSVRFDDAVSNLVASAFDIRNGSVQSVVADSPVDGLSSNWTVRVAPADLSAASLDVAVAAIGEGSALDNFGNRSQAWSGNVSVAYDGKAPTPTLASSADGTKQNTDTFTVTVTFDEPVTGLAKEDFTIANGTATALAGSGASYTLTVKCAANSKQEGAATTVTLASGKCQDAAGNGNAAAGQTISVTYDTTSPTPTLSSAADGMKQNTDTFTVTVSFDEAVTGLAKEDFTIANGTATRLEAASPMSYTLTVKCAANSAQEGVATTVALASGTCQDAAGNGNAAAGQTISVTYDTTSPTPTLASTADGTKQKTDTFRVSITFDEAVTGLEVGDFSIANGTATRLEAASPMSYTLTVQCAANSAQEGVATTVALASGTCQDAAGNGNAAAGQTISVTYDTTSPTPTLASTADGKKQNTETFTVTVTFNEAVTGLEVGDFSIVNGTATRLEAASPMSYTLTVQCAANSAQEGVATTVALASGKCQDAAGNGNAAASQTISVTYDTTSPTPTLASTADGTKQKTDTFTVTVSFDEAVTGLEVGDFSIENGTATRLEAASPMSYTLTVKCAANSAQEGVATTVTLASGKCQDAAGNGNNAASQTISVTYDTTAPTPTLSSDADGKKQNTETFTVTVSFNEAVTGLEVGDFSIANGTATRLEAASPMSYTLTVTCAANSAQEGVATTVTLASGKCQDAAGNGNNAAGQTISVTYDTTAPTPTLASDADGGKQNTDTFTVTVSFNEPVDGLAKEDFTVVNGTATRLEAASPMSYTLTVTCAVNSAQEGVATAVTLASGKCQDAAGNGNNAASQTISVTYDTTKPVITLANVPANPTSAGDFAIGMEADEDGDLSWSVQCGGRKVAEGTGTGAGPWTAQGSGLAEGTYAFSATVVDAAGNASQPATCQWTVTRAQPTVSITAPSPALVQDDTATFTIAFGEAVLGFTQDDLTVLGGTVSSFTGSGSSYTVAVQATHPGTTVGLGLAAHVCTNALGIGNAAADSVTCEVDYTEPVIGPLSVSPERFSRGQMVTFSFDVTDERLASVKVFAGQEPILSVADASSGRFTFEHIAEDDGLFTIVATDAVGNTASASNVGSGVEQDNAEPSLTWSGLPAGSDSVSGAVTPVLSAVVDDDGSIALSWALLAGSGANAVTNDCGEGWAVEGMALLFNDLVPGERYEFVWTAVDRAGNEASGQAAWTMAALDPDAPVTVSGVPNGDAAVFTVTWQDRDDIRVSLDNLREACLLRVNNAATGDVSVAMEPGATSATVTVPLASYTAGAYVELVVAAGTLGNRLDSNAARVSFTPAPAPALAYVGRSFTNNAEVVWRLSNVGAADPTAHLSATAPGVDGSLALAVRRDGNDWLVSATETWVPTAAATNAGWEAVAPSYRNIRLVYDDLAGHAVTNVGLAEANVARAVYGGDAFLKIYSNATDRCYSYPTDVPNYLGLDFEKGIYIGGRYGQDNYSVAADGVFQANRIKGAWPDAYQSASYSPSSYAYGEPRAAVITSWETLLFRACNGGDAALGSTWGDTVFHSFQWQTTPSLVNDNDPWEMQNVAISVTDPTGNTRYWSTNVTVNAAETIHRVDIPDVKGRAVTLRVVTSSKLIGTAANGYYVASIVEAAAMGTPVRAYEAPTPAIVLDRTVTDDNRLHFHVAFDQPVDAGSYDSGKLSVSGLSGVAGFEISNQGPRSCDIAVSGLSGNGTLALALAEGFAKTMAGTHGTGSDVQTIGAVPTVAATCTVEVDAALPAAAFLAPAEQAGICTFTLATSEDATGVGTNGLTLVTNRGATVEAGIIALERDGTNVVATVRATQWTGGDTLALRFAGILRDLAGNTNAVDVTSEAVTFADPTTAAVPSVAIAAGANGTISPLGTVAAVGGALANVVATPHAGYEFAGWSVAPASATTNAATGAVTASFTGLADGSAVTATFAAIGSVTVTASVSGSGGTVSPASASVAIGGSASVLVEASAGYRIASVATNGVSIADAVGKPAYLVSLANLQANVAVVAAFESIPDVTITIRDGEAAATTATVVWNGDWSREFMAAEGKRIASLTVNGAHVPAAAGATNYIVQLFGVVEATTVVVAYEDIPVPPTLWTVTFSTERGTAPATQTVEEGALATNPGAPAYAGTDYTFVEWRLDGATYNFSTPVTGNITLVAVWEEAEADEFTMTDLAWTGFDPATGVLSFTVTVSGSTPPETVTLVYRTTLGGSDQKAEACEWILDAEKGEGTVTVPANLRSLPAAFFIGLEAGAEE